MRARFASRLATHESRTARCGSRASLDFLDREQVPVPGNPCELANSPVCETNPRAGDEILDRARDEDLPRLRLCGDTRTGMDGDTRDLAVDELAFAGV